MDDTETQPADTTLTNVLGLSPKAKMDAMNDVIGTLAWEVRRLRQEVELLVAQITALKIRGDLAAQNYVNHQPT